MEVFHTYTQTDERYDFIRLFARMRTQLKLKYDQFMSLQIVSYLWNNISNSITASVEICKIYFFRRNVLLMTNLFNSEPKAESGYRSNTFRAHPALPFEKRNCFQKSMNVRSRRNHTLMLFICLYRHFGGWRGGGGEDQGT